MSAPYPPEPAEDTVEPPAPPVRWRLRGHARAAGVFLLLAILLSGVVYPLALTGIAGLLAPRSAAGSLLTCSNGTVVGSALVAQDLSSGTLGPSLFWSRPSLTDYNMTLGIGLAPGPSEPALLALLNETVAYMRVYGNLTVNATVPFWWAAPSASSVDPDLVPEAVLVQVPRVASANNLSVASVLALVNAHITTPPLPFLGEAFVNVLELDIALLQSLGRC